MIIDNLGLYVLLFYCGLWLYILMKIFLFVGGFFFGFLLFYNKMMELNDWYFLWILNYILV